LIDQFRSQWMFIHHHYHHQLEIHKNIYIALNVNELERMIQNSRRRVTFQKSDEVGITNQFKNMQDGIASKYFLAKLF